MSNPASAEHSSAWVSFTYASFIGSVAMMVGGILYLPLEIWVKGYMLMGVMMLIQSAITVTKTVRDVHESRKLLNRIEDAKTEQLLMRIDTGK
ncbi:YiaA/YiaB family inner membrane protein [Prosthecomicrobium sp. N25]|uniref:YiaA/YiaB family inner membrane protein n=1 Tax=Prosthecomicrobium sp. N25 TaxID=3129254 RepID=UPI00307817C4